METEAPRKVEKVISGTAKHKEKTLGNRIIDTFLPDDTSSIKDYVIFDVLVPTIKRGLDEAFHMLLFNGAPTERRSTSSQRVTFSTNKTPYHDPGSIGRGSSKTIRSTYEYNDIIFEYREDALSVLRTLDGLIEQYHNCSVQDLFSAADLECDYTANDWGWYDIRSAEVVPVRGGGYMIRFPKIQPLK